MCEIPSPCFNAVFPGFLLGRGSRPPDFANRCVKLLAILLMCRCLLSIVFLGSLFCFPWTSFEIENTFQGKQFGAEQQHMNQGPAYAISSYQ